MPFQHIFSATGLANYQWRHGVNLTADLQQHLQSALPQISTVGFYSEEHDPVMVVIQWEGATDLTQTQLQNIVTAINNRLAALGISITMQLIS